MSFAERFAGVVDDAIATLVRTEYGVQNQPPEVLVRRLSVPHTLYAILLWRGQDRLPEFEFWVADEWGRSHIELRESVARNRISDVWGLGFFR